MNRVTEYVFIGDGADGQDLATAQKVGIRAVLNACPEVDGLAENIDAYRQLDHNDGEPWPAIKLESALSFLANTVRERWPVLVHCAAGQSRAPSLVIAWLMMAGFSWDEAESYVKSKRPQTAVHPALKESILNYFEGARNM